MDDTEGEQRDWLARLSSLDLDSASAEDVFFCFRLLLGRAPTPREWKEHLFASEGRKLGDIVHGFLASREFAERDWPSSGEPALIDYGDFRIYCDPEDRFVGAGVFTRQYEPEVVAVFKEYLRPGMTVLDLGANIGFFTMLAASLVGPTGKVYAIEPNPLCVRLLEASRRENRFEHVEVHCIAAATGPGILSMTGPHTVSTGVTERLRSSTKALLAATIVPAIDIPRILPSDVDVNFLKIDVDGGEPEAMRGLEPLIRRCHPIIVTEFSPPNLTNAGADPGLYFASLTEPGYSAAVIALSGPPIPVSTFHEAEMLRGGDRQHVDLLLTPASPPRGANETDGRSWRGRWPFTWKRR